MWLWLLQLLLLLCSSGFTRNGSIAAFAVLIIVPVLFFCIVTMMLRGTSDASPFLNLDGGLELSTADDLHLQLLAGHGEGFQNTEAQRSQPQKQTAAKVRCLKSSPQR